jgi:hypothetical protein
MTSSSPLAELILTGRAATNIKEYAARGIAPLPADELIAVQIFLTADADSKIADDARASLALVSEAVWSRLVETKNPSVHVIEYCISNKSISNSVREKIVLNNTVSDEVVARIATTANGPLLDLIITNHVRLLRAPEILYALEQNRSATVDQKRRIDEFKAEFIFKKPQEPEPGSPAAAKGVESLSFDDILAQIPNLDPEIQKLIKEADANPQPPASQEQIEQTLKNMFSDEELKDLPSDVLTTYQRIMKMKQGEKLRTALLGTKEERSFLIRDSSRQVASLVLRNPKITEPEVESFSQLRNIDSELLRHIGKSREFVKRYGVVHNLVRNPKTPSPIALNLLKLLREADLRNLARDKNIPELIRRQAKKIYDMKNVSR